MSARKIVPFGLKREAMRVRRTMLLSWRRSARRCLWTSVQSPMIYRFFIDVVRNRSAYYAYSEFAREWGVLSRRQRRVGKLLFRLANYVRADVVFVPQRGGEPWIPFLRRGSCISRVATYRDGAELLAEAKSSLKETKPSLALVNSDDDDVVEALAEVSFARGSIIVVPDIVSTPARKRGWKQMCAAPWANVSIDLYCAGIIMIDATFSNLYYKTVL